MFFSVATTVDPRMLESSATEVSSTDRRPRYAHGNLLPRHALPMAFWASASEAGAGRDELPVGGADEEEADADRIDAGPLMAFAEFMLCSMEDTLLDNAETASASLSILAPTCRTSAAVDSWRASMFACC